MSDAIRRFNKVATIYEHTLNIKTLTLLAIAYGPLLLTTLGYFLIAYIFQKDPNSSKQVTVFTISMIIIQLLISLIYLYLLCSVSAKITDSQ